MISNLGRFKDDRQEYKTWAGKLKNAIEQVNPDLRITLEKIEITYWAKGEEIEWKEKEDAIKEEGAIDETDGGHMEKDLYAILVDKCDGDAFLLVKNRSRDGLMGYLKLNKFFTEASGRGMADRRRAAMRPEKSKKEEDIFRNVEKWEKKWETWKEFRESQ